MQGYMHKALYTSHASAPRTYLQVLESALVGPFEEQLCQRLPVVMRVLIRHAPPQEQGAF